MSIARKVLLVTYLLHDTISLVVLCLCMCKYSCCSPNPVWYFSTVLCLPVFFLGVHLCHCPTGLGCASGAWTLPAGEHLPLAATAQPRHPLLGLSSRARTEVVSALLGMVFAHTWNVLVASTHFFCMFKALSTVTIWGSAPVLRHAAFLCFQRNWDFAAQACNTLPERRNPCAAAVLSSLQIRLSFIAAGSICNGD